MLLYRYPNEELGMIYAPLAVMAVVAYATGTMFMSVWGLGTDSIL